MDSNLEAFSYNPADGSFAALPGRTAELSSCYEISATIEDKAETCQGSTEKEWITSINRRFYNRMLAYEKSPDTQQKWKR